MAIDNFVLIIGAMKCGTTSLFNYLAEHPQIAPCKEKEPSFFSGKVNYEKGFDYYQNLWDWQPEVHKIAMEASTSYTRVTNPIYVNAAENIKQQEQSGCRFKFIYIMRNPLDRIESHYTHAAAWKSKELQADIAAQTIHTEAVDVSKYAMQLDEYYQRFDAEDILLVDFNDLKHRKKEMLERICCFLDIDFDYRFEQLDAAHNQNEKKTRISIPGWYAVRHTPFMKLVNKKMPRSTKSIFYRLFKRQVDNKYIRLSAGQKETILDEIKLDLEKLNTEYKFDISQWKFKAHSNDSSRTQV